MDVAAGNDGNTEIYLAIVLAFRCSFFVAYLRVAENRLVLKGFLWWKSGVTW